MPTNKFYHDDAIITGSLFGTASYARNSLTASYALSSPGGGSGVVATYTNGTDNRVITSTGTDGITAETNLTFNGSTLAVTGNITANSFTGSLNGLGVRQILGPNLNNTFGNTLNFSTASPNVPSSLFLICKAVLSNNTTNDIVFSIFVSNGTTNASDECVVKLANQTKTASTLSTVLTGIPANTTVTGNLQFSAVAGNTVFLSGINLVGIFMPS